jgi:hypothetical protein
MDPQSFSQMMASYGQPQQADQTDPTQQTNSEQAPQQTAQPQQHGNWFTHLMPTIGGIGGGILGAVFGGGVGGIGGGAGGSALGKVLENKIEGQGAGNGVLSNALQGAIGEGVGGAIGKVGGGLMKTVGGKAEGVADSLVKGQFTKGALKTADANALRTAGVADARQIPQIADMVTGTNGALNQGVIRGLGESDVPANLSGLAPLAKDLVSQNQMQLSASSIPDISKTLNSALLKATNPDDVTQLATKGAGGPVNIFQSGALGNVLPSNAFDVAKNFETLAASARNAAYDKMGAVINPDQLAKSKIFTGLADHAKQAAFGGDTPIPLSVTNKAQIISELDPLRGVNPAAHATLVDQVNNATNLQDLRGLQAPFVKGSQAAKATDLAAERGAGTNANQVMNNLTIPGAIAGGPHGMMAGLGAQMLRSPTMDRAAIPLVEKGGSILSNIGGATLGKASVPGLAGGAGGVLSATSNNMLQNNGTVGDTMQPANQLAPQPTGQPANDPATAQMLFDLGLYSPGALASIAPNQQQVQNVTNANAATTALQGLGNAPSGGILSSLQGHLGIGGTGEYQRKAASAAQQVAAAIPGTDAGAIEKQLTDYMAGGGNIDDAIKGLLERLGGVMKSNQGTGIGGILGVNAAPPQTVTSQLPVAAL